MKNKSLQQQIIKREEDGKNVPLNILLAIRFVLNRQTRMCRVYT